MWKLRTKSETGGIFEPLVPECKASSKFPGEAELSVTACSKPGCLEKACSVNGLPPQTPSLVHQQRKLKVQSNDCREVYRKDPRTLDSPERPPKGHSHEPQSNANSGCVYNTFCLTTRVT